MELRVRKVGEHEPTHFSIWREIRWQIHYCKNKKTPRMMYIKKMKIDLHEWYIFWCMFDVRLLYNISYDL